MNFIRLMTFIWPTKFIVVELHKVDKVHLAKRIVEEVKLHPHFVGIKGLDKTRLIYMEEAPRLKFLIFGATSQLFFAFPLVLFQPLTCYKLFNSNFFSKGNKTFGSSSMFGTSILYLPYMF